MIASVTSWWNSREPREHLLLAILGGLVGVFLIVFVIVLPVRAATTSAHSQLDQAKAELILVSRLSPSAGASGPRAAFDRSVLITVARSNDIRLTRIQPGNDGSFSVWIDDVQTQSLYTFFEGLVSDYAVTLDRVVVNSDANGRLSTQFTVR